MKEINDLITQLQTKIVDKYGVLPREVVAFMIELRKWMREMEEKK